MIKIKLSEKYKANDTKRIGNFTVTRRWQECEKEIAIIAEKIGPDVYELQKAVLDLPRADKPVNIPTVLKTEPVAKPKKSKSGKKKKR